MILKKHASFDPSENVSLPKITPSTPKFLSALEYRALRDVVRDDTRNRAIVEIIIQKDMRISEIEKMKNKNLKLNELTIESYATQPARTIPLNKPAHEALDRYMKIRPKSESEYVFVSKNGKPLAVRNIRAAIDRYLQKA